MNNNWQCESGDSQWTFDFNTCDWVTTQGTKSLIEVRDNKDQDEQSFLGM